MKIKFNKILIFSCVFLLVVCSFTSCFAFSYTSDSGDFSISYDLSSYGYNEHDFPYIYIFQLSRKDLYSVVISKEPGVYDPTTGGGANIWISSDCISFQYMISNSSVVSLKETTDSHLVADSTATFLYLSHDVKDSSGNVVFQGAPRPVEQITLAKVVQEAEPAKKFQTTIVGILPYLIAFLVGLVAFWKAWSILSRWLHRA